MLLSKIVSSLIEIIVLSTIPFIWWFFTSRKKENFLTWIGLKRAETSASKKVIPEIAFILLLMKRFLY